VAQREQRAAARLECLRRLAEADVPLGGEKLPGIAMRSASWSLAPLRRMGLVEKVSKDKNQRWKWTITRKGRALLAAEAKRLR
jgi:hypothetical protein